MAPSELLDTTHFEKKLQAANAYVCAWYHPPGNTNCEDLASIAHNASLQSAKHWRSGTCSFRSVCCFKPYSQSYLPILQAECDSVKDTHECNYSRASDSMTLLSRTHAVAAADAVTGFGANCMYMRPWPSSIWDQWDHLLCNLHNSSQMQLNTLPRHIGLLLT